MEKSKQNDLVTSKKSAIQRLYGLHDFGVLVAAIAIAVFLLSRPQLS